MTPRCTRSSCTSAPTSSRRPGRRRRAGVSAETPACRPAGARPPCGPGAVPRRGRTRDQRQHRADDRLHRGLAWMRHDRDGAVLDLGRRRRRPNAALRRAARERDKCRCRFPGCESRRVDLHHIQYWSHGGRDQPGQPGQPVQLPPHAGPRARVPDRRAAGRHVRLLPPGRHRPPGQPRPAAARRHASSDCHDADITPDTIIPPWYGERLDLDEAIYICLANARTPEERAAAAGPGRRRRSRPSAPANGCGRTAAGTGSACLQPH